MDASNVNPLSRAYFRLMTRGKPFKKAGYVFLQDYSKEHDQFFYRWFGIFTVNAGGRLSFFPGHNEQPCKAAVSRGGGSEQVHEFAVDHLTLEKDYRSSHYTTQGSSDHIGPFPTTILKDGDIYWFGMTVKNSEVFRPVHERTLCRVKTPKSDWKRRSASWQVISQDFSGHQIVPDEQLLENKSNWVWLFEVIVGDGRVPTYNRVNVRVVRNNGSTRQIEEIPQRATCQDIQYALAPELGVYIQIRISRWPYEQSIPINYGSL